MSTSSLPSSSRTDSFVTNILATAGRLEKEDLSTKLTQLSSKIDEVKLELFEALQKKYVDFHPIFDSTQLLGTRLSSVSDEMNTLTASIDRQVKGQVRVSSSEYDVLLTGYEESKATVQILTRLVDINEALQALSKAVCGGQQLVVATELLTRLDGMFSNLIQCHGTGIKVIPCLRMVCQGEKEKLETCLSDKWIEFIQWTIDIVSDVDSNNQRRNKVNINGEGGNKVELLFPGGADRSTQLAAVTQALSNMAALDSNVRSLCASLMKYIVRPCLVHPRTHVAVSGGKSIISVSVKEVPQAHQTDVMWSIADTLEAFKHLKVIVDVLQQALGGITIARSVLVEQESGRVESKTEECTLMMCIGETIVDELLRILIDDCLAPSVPTSQSELGNYEEIISATRLLETNLASIKLLTPGLTVLTDYVSNVTALCVNKKCQQLLEQARTLMMSPLHNVVTVGVPDRVKLFSLDLVGEVKNASAGSKEKGSVSDDRIDEVAMARVFNFPVCQISVSVKQLVELAYEILHETTTGLTTSLAVPVKNVSAASKTSKDTSSRSAKVIPQTKGGTQSTAGGSVMDVCLLTPQCAIQLFYAVRNIFELYISIVPVYHRERLVSLPLFAAVHHNDCMYIAHHLPLLSHQFRAALPPPLSTGHATFVDLVPVVRRLAVSSLMDQLTLQKTNLLDLYSTTHGFVGVGEGNYNESSVRAVKQSMLQLRHLGTVWRDVLPSSVYVKALGSLLNAIVSEIISSIIALVDISVTDAECLHSLLSIIQQAGPELTRQSLELNPEAVDTMSSMYKHCAKWNQLNQMMFMLKASLTEIGERWADGKGPLAVEFTASQLKQLVKALFQNTEKRDSVLLTIR